MLWQQVDGDTIMPGDYRAIGCPKQQRRSSPASMSRDGAGGARASRLTRAFERISGSANIFAGYAGIADLVYRRHWLLSD